MRRKPRQESCSHDWVHGFCEQLFADLDLPLLILDRNLNVVRANASAEELAGQDESRMMGQPLKTVLQLEEAVVRALRSPKPARPADGGAWYSITCSPRRLPGISIRLRSRKFTGVDGEAVTVVALEQLDWTERFREWMTGVPVLFLELDPAGMIRFGAEKLAERLGLGGKRAAARRLEALVAADHRDLFAQMWTTALSGESVRSRELRLANARGLPQPFWLSLFPVRDAKGRITGVRGIAGDLAGEKDLAYALEAAEERFSVLFRESSDPILILSMNGEALSANPSFEQITGLTSDQLFSGEKGWKDFVHGEDLDTLLTTVRRCAKTQNDEVTEVRVRDAQGHIVWYEQSHSILHDERGKARGIMTVARDINRRKQQEMLLRERADALQRRSERAQALISKLKQLFTRTASLPEEVEGFLGGICDVLFDMYDPLLVALTLREQRRWVVRARTGVPQAVIDRPCDDLPCAACEQVIETGMPFFCNTLDSEAPCKYEGVLKSMGLRTCVSAPLRDSGGRTLGSIVLLDTESRSFDSLDVEVLTVAALQVAARLRAEEQEGVRRELEEHLRQAQKMEAVGMLAGGIAHDFNNILSGIMGFSSYLLAKTEPGTPLHRDLGLIDQSAGRAAELTRQLLAFARRRHFAKEPIALNGIIEEVLGILMHSVSKNIRVEKRLDEKLPPILGDAGQLNQVIMNLCLNAADAMSEKGGALTVATEHRPLSVREHAVLVDAKYVEYVCVTVADTGRGMSPEVMAHIFDPFFTTKVKKGGTGLGLSIVYGIVSNHRGDITVDSEEGRGTTFKVFFPAYEGPVEEKKAVEKRALTGTETVLVVDDEPIVRQMVVEVLKGQGYHVLSASSGEEGVDLFQHARGKVDIVLLDLVMPGLGGEGAFNAIMETDENARILLTSGFAQEELSERLMRAGAKGMVFKPYKSDALLGAVRDTLDGRAP